MSMEAVTHAVNVRLGDDRNSVVILDQTLLPNESLPFSNAGTPLHNPQEGRVS